MESKRSRVLRKGVQFRACRLTHPHTTLGTGRHARLRGARAVESSAAAGGAGSRRARPSFFLLLLLVAVRAALVEANAIDEVDQIHFSTLRPDEKKRFAQHIDVGFRICALWLGP